MNNRVLLALLPILAMAHDTYLMPETFFPKAGQKILVSVHSSDGFPKSENPVDSSRIVKSELVVKGKATPVTGYQIVERASHVEITAPGTAAWLTFQTQGRLLQLEAPKFLEYLKHEGLTNVIKDREAKGESNTKSRERYAKFAKTYFAGPNFTSEAAGMLIEFVPLQDPAKKAAALPVQLLFRGKPAADVQVIRSTIGGPEGTHLVIGRTDSQGKINVPLAGVGKHRLHAIVMERVRETQVDWESHWASLTFEVR
jgi:hypothetical protein